MQKQLLNNSSDLLIENISLNMRFKSDMPRLVFLLKEVNLANSLSFSSAQALSND